MAIEEIEEQFNQLQQDLKEVSKEIESDAHMDFINYLKQYVNKY